MSVGFIIFSDVSTAWAIIRRQWSEPCTN